MARCTLIILDPTDTIRGHDWLRPLYLSRDLDGGVDSHSIWGGSPINNLLWCPVHVVLGKDWFGKQIKELYATNTYSGKEFYEFARGTPPITHQLPKDQYRK